MSAFFPFFTFFVTDTDGLCPGITVSDNSGNVNYKCLASLRWDTELRGYVETHDQQVPHNTEAVPIEFGIVMAEVKNERNVAKSRRITEELTPGTVVNKHTGTGWDQLKDLADEWTVTKTMASSSATDAVATTGSGFLLGSSDTEMHNPANWKKDKITVLAWGTRTRNFVDDELGLKMTETRSVVAHGTALPTATAGAFYQQQQVDNGRDILTAITIDGYPSTQFERTYISTEDYTFPTLLASWDGNPANAPVPANGLVFANSFEEDNARSVFQITVYLREAFTENIFVKTIETLLTAADVATLISAGDNASSFGSGADLGTSTTRARIFTPRPRDIAYDGLMFNLRVPNVLCDGDTITATSSSEDTYYGASVVESFTYPNSFPTATQYVALIGLEVCIADDITPWRYGLFKRTRKIIKLK